MRSRRTAPHSARSSSAGLSALGRFLNSVFRAVHSRRIFGERVPVLLSGARSAAFARLDGEDKVRLDRNVAVFDEDLVRAALDAPWNAEDRLANAALTCVHELVHVWQRIDVKWTVRNLRSVGDETELRHLDLGSDHIAAVLLARPLDSDIISLKDLQSRSVLEYRISASHSLQSRARKRDRFLSLRADVVSGRLFHAGDEDEIEQRYVYINLFEATSTIAVYEARGPGRLLRSTTLDAEQFACLVNPYSVSEASENIVRIVDRVFGEVLVSSRRDSEPRDTVAIGEARRGDEAGKLLREV